MLVLVLWACALCMFVCGTGGVDTFAMEIYNTLAAFGYTVGVHCTYTLKKIYGEGNWLQGYPCVHSEFALVASETNPT